MPRAIWRQLRRLVARHDGNDNSAYWRSRAVAPGSAAVLWQNPDYNALVRAREFAILAPLLAALPAGARVLDVGCGIGTVTRWLLEQRPDLQVHCVDFPEMIARARVELADDARVTFVAAGADTFATELRFDLVLSSGCYSAIRHRPTCEQALANGLALVASGGQLVMIDPFHRWVYLARVRMSAREVIAQARAAGFTLQRYDGILFWPLREVLANSRLPAPALARWFAFGERLLAVLGPRLWSDYKVLVFRRP